jgi:7-cyano-7-deazaguanine synthase
MATLVVVILSGGLDSTTALAEARNEHGPTDVKAITFDYGQRHRIEIDSAMAIADYYAVEHKIVHMNPYLFEGGSLTSDEPVKDMRYDDLPSGTMSPTYVPFRNANLISGAVSYADSLLRRDDAWNDSGPKWENALVYAGMHAEDAAGFAYADCTPEFLGAMASAVYVGTYGCVRLNALYQHSTKAEIIKRGIALHAPYGMTYSCYRGELPSCGKCSTCHARIDAFEEAGFIDPLPYKEGVNAK